MEDARVRLRLPDPSSFPKLAVQPLGPELAILRRYIAAAEDMAESALLSGEDRFTVRVSDDGAGAEHVDATFTTSETTRGFTTLFRQFDASKEAAGFDQVQRILRQTGRASPDESSPERVEQLRRWGKARGSLRAENLKVRVGQQLRTDGRWPAPIPGEGKESPASLISKYQYGDLIHWRGGGSILELSTDPFEYALQRMAFLEAAAGLTHIYLGFALLVRAALDDKSGPSPPGR